MARKDPAYDPQPASTIISTLISLIETDTLYGDLYHQRAKELLQGEIPFETYRGLLRMEGEINSFPNRIENAMTKGDWRTVQEMTAEMQSLKLSYQIYGGLLPLAKRLYEQEEIFIDPFSAGMLALAGKSPSQLPALREQVLTLLRVLMASDTGWKEFYTKRYFDFEEELPLTVNPGTGAAEMESPDRLQQEAEEALHRGDLGKLKEVAAILAKGDDGPGSTGSSRQAELAEAAGRRRFDYKFPDAVLKKARPLGLAPFNAESRFPGCEDIAPFFWHPTFPEVESQQGRALRLSELHLAPGTPQGLRNRIELYLLHPFINSAGVRYIPPLVVEDALVEDFDEPAANAGMPMSPLLERLGLKRRNSLTRLEIESALAHHGYQVVKEDLGLDPVEFRLVCIPPDLHLRIGINRGWGTQEIWTHFDGYMLTADGRMHALAGGDARFGGIYDLVGIGRNYQTDRIIVRFAVVQRRRMARVDG
jgi:hypothetical protein